MTEDKIRKAVIKYFPLPWMTESEKRYNLLIKDLAKLLGREINHWKKISDDNYIWMDDRIKARDKEIAELKKKLLLYEEIKYEKLEGDAFVDQAPEEEK